MQRYDKGLTPEVSPIEKCKNVKFCKLQLRFCYMGSRQNVADYSRLT